MSKWFIKICGIKEYLLNQGVFPEFVDYALSSKFPKKMQKWVAFQLQKKYKINNKTNQRDTQLIQDYLNQHEESLIEVRDWFNWMSHNENNFDINKYDLDSVVLLLPDFHEVRALQRAQQKGTGHPKLYKYPNFNAEDLGDGFKMVELIPVDLKNEGALMQHCVGDEEQEYAESIKDRHSVIYSLRDSKNYPHATIEIQMQNMPHNKPRYRLNQIQGKQNQPPVDKYKQYIKKWLESHQNEINVNYSQRWKYISTTDELIEEMIENQGGNGTAIIFQYLPNEAKIRLAQILKQITLKNPNLEWSDNLKYLLLGSLNIMYDPEDMEIYVEFSKVQNIPYLNELTKNHLTIKFWDICSMAEDEKDVSKWVEVYIRILNNLPYQLIDRFNNQNAIKYLQQLQDPNKDEDFIRRLYDIQDNIQDNNSLLNEQKIVQDSISTVEQ